MRALFTTSPLYSRFSLWETMNSFSSWHIWIKIMKGISFSSTSKISRHNIWIYYWFLKRPYFIFRRTVRDITFLTLWILKSTYILHKLLFRVSQKTPTASIRRVYRRKLYLHCDSNINFKALRCWRDSECLVLDFQARWQHCDRRNYTHVCESQN